MQNARNCVFQIIRACKSNWKWEILFFLFYPEILQGQTESKKRSSTLETKGTAISFGFKKKLLPSHKRSTVNAKTKGKDAENNDRLDTVDSERHEFDFDDNNGNCGERCMQLVRRFHWLFITNSIFSWNMWCVRRQTNAKINTRTPSWHTFWHSQIEYRAAGLNWYHLE